MILVFLVELVFEVVDGDKVVMAVSAVCVTDMEHIDDGNAVDVKLWLQVAQFASTVNPPS